MEICRYSTLPGGFAARLWGSPKLWGNSFIRSLLVTDNMFEHRLYLSKIGHTFLNGVSLSDLI